VEKYPVDEEAVVALTRDLVRLRTVNEDGAKEAPAAELVAATMRAFGWDPHITEVAPGRPNVVAVVEGGGGPGRTLAFEGHTDVVTEGARDRWSVAPSGGAIRDGRRTAAAPPT
jgi:succinyl-diaminopimelate desuccinylase